MEMDFLQALGAAVVLGSTLGATVAGFFAYRQKSLVTLLRESNNDYKERVEQLENERDTQKSQLKTLEDKVKHLESEKLIPLENLTKLIVNQHTQQMKSIDKLANAMLEMAKSTSKRPKQ